MASSQGNQSQKSSSSSSSQGQQSQKSSSSVPSLEPHQPSMEYPITGSTSASGSSGDQPGPSGLQAGPSGLLNGSLLDFPTSQEMDLNDFDFPVYREEGAGTHLPPTGRIDAGARSGHVSDDNVNAIVPHTETSSSGEDTVDNAVVPHNQGTHPLLQQPTDHIVYDPSPQSDLSQQSLVVPSQSESCSDDQAVPRQSRKKSVSSDKVGVQFSPPLLQSYSSNGSSSDGPQLVPSPHSLPQDSGTCRPGHDLSSEESSVDPPSTTTGTSSSSGSSQEQSTSSHECDQLFSSFGIPRTSQNQSVLQLSQSPDDGSLNIPATPDPADMPSVSSDVDNVISNTPDADGSSQEMFRSTPVDENHVSRFKRQRSYDADDDASSLEEGPPKRPKRSPLTTSSQSGHSSGHSATLSPTSNDDNFKTPKKPPPSLQRTSGGSSSGSSLGTTSSSSSSSSSVPYPSSSSSSSSLGSGAIGRSSSSLSTSDTKSGAQTSKDKLDTSKEDAKETDERDQSKDATPEPTVKQSGGDRPSVHDTTPEPIASQSMDDATISLDVMTTNIPSSLPVGDEEFNLHLSNATTECSIVSTSVATQDEVLEESQVESQNAVTSSSSSDQVEDTPTPEDDHVTSPSLSPDDDSAAGGGANSGGQEDDQQGGQEDNDERKDQDDDKDNDRAEENNEEHQEDGSSQDDCTIVNVIPATVTMIEEKENTLSLSAAEIVTNSSEFQLGISRPSSSDTFVNSSVTLDSPVKVPAVVDEFSQDSFPQLSIKRLDISTLLPTARPVSSTMPPSSLATASSAKTHYANSSSSNGDPFEFHSQDNEGEVLPITRTPPPPPNQQSTAREPKEQHNRNSAQNDILDVSNKTDDTVPEDDEAVPSVPVQVVNESSSINADSTRFNIVIPSVSDQVMNQLQPNPINTDSNRSEVCNEVTPSEHGQVVDRSSEDPLNSEDVRSEMASSNVSSPQTLISEVHNVADVSIVPCQSSVPDTAERQSRTTIVTKKTTIILKTFKEEEFINDQWVTTDEYQEELDPVEKVNEEVRYLRSFPPRTISSQDLSSNSSFQSSPTPVTSQKTPKRRMSTPRTQPAFSTPSTSRCSIDSSPDIQHTRTRLRSLCQQVETLECSDDRVLGRWKDGQWYPGTIQEVLDNGKHVILFDDGDRKVLPKTSVVKMSLLRVGSEVMVISDDNDEDYLRGSITGRCAVDGKPGYLVNTGGKEPLRCPESDLMLTPLLIKQLTTISPSPVTSPAVRSKRSVMSTPSSSKRRKISSSPTVSTTSSSLLFSELSFVITGEGKGSPSLGDQISTNGGIVMAEFPSDVCPAKTFLLADKARRTEKYFLALANGVPCIRPSWAKECLKQVRTVMDDQTSVYLHDRSSTAWDLPWTQ
ncbi:serine-rich adhesin for platelets-like isoform X2 [Dysidea avara]|uniref:serine-rich adhesin for platelets-like isoform X2 n=1 Tax=Dysidea avara TaxID=196820 RepID=UPI00332283AE